MELAKELGMEQDISNSPFLIVPRKGEIKPIDARDKSSFSSKIIRRRYTKFFRDFADGDVDGDKRTIKGYSDKFFKVSPLSKKQLTKKVLLCILMGTMVTSGVNTGVIEAMKLENAHKYAAQIDDYDSRMDEYAEEIRNMNLTDIQTVMKIIDDMHSNIQGYGNPEEDIIGFMRLNVGDSDGYGVCRNMADNTTYILNKVNPRYHARNMFVDMNAETIHMADIDRKSYQPNQDTHRESGSKEQEEKSSNPFTSNHCVTVIDVPGKDYSLMIDTTNPAIGLLGNSQIIMLNNADGSFNYKPLAEGLLGYRTIIAKNGIKMSKQFDDEELEEIKDKWGLDAQNKALKAVRNIPGAIQMAKKAYTSQYEEPCSVLSEDERGENRS